MENGERATKDAEIQAKVKLTSALVNAGFVIKNHDDMVAKAGENLKGWCVVEKHIIDPEGMIERLVEMALEDAGPITKEICDVSVEIYEEGIARAMFFSVDPVEWEKMVRVHTNDSCASAELGNCIGRSHIMIRGVDKPDVLADLPTFTVILKKKGAKGIFNYNVVVGEIHYRLRDECREIGAAGVHLEDDGDVAICRWTLLSKEDEIHGDDRKRKPFRRDGQLVTVMY